MTDPTSSRPGALAGLRVIDFSRMLPGPWGTQMLADLGADVIKIEQPVVGDLGRHNAPNFRHGSVYFNTVNLNKRSVVLDLASEHGRLEALRLIESADVVVESFRSGVAARLGIDYEAARRVKPDVVYCSITGFGSDGPMAAVPGHDMVVQAVTGTMGTGAPGTLPPVPGFQSADYAAGANAVIAILAALQQRARTGQGANLEIAMFDALLAMTNIVNGEALARAAGNASTPRMELWGGNPRYCTYLCRDGKPVAIALLESRIWAHFCSVIERPDLVDPAETPEHRHGAHGERGALYREVLTQLCASRDRDDLVAWLGEHDVPIVPVYTPEEALASPHARARGVVEWIDHPSEGRIPVLANPLARSGLTTGTRTPAPDLGDHTAALVRPAIAESSAPHTPVQSRPSEGRSTMKIATPTAATNRDRIAAFALSMPRRSLPEEILEAARFATVDWFGCALGAFDQPSASQIRQVVTSWHASGRSPVFYGAPSTAVASALANGTMAHCLDFDDTHVGSISHLSGPTWAAALAVGAETGAKPVEMLRAFIAGFEVSGRLGRGGFGVAANERHLHATGVFGAFGAAIAASVLYGLDADGLGRAIGLAATQVGGLTGSFGTPAKPFHAGKAAFNGVLAAQMARQGYGAATDLVEPGGGLGKALVQDGSFTVEALDFEDGWELTRNTYKPYASCLLTHPVIDSARELSTQLAGRDISHVEVRVHPLSIQLAGQTEPATPLAGKFSLAFCAALGLTGRRATQTDFSHESVADDRLQSIASRVTLVPVASMDLRAADVVVDFAQGDRLTSHTPLALGNPDRPMSWQDMERKFLSLTGTPLGDHAKTLFERLRSIDAQPDLESLMQLVSIAQPAAA